MPPAYDNIRSAYRMLVDGAQHVATIDNTGATDETGETADLEGNQTQGSVWAELDLRGLVGDVDITVELTRTSGTVLPYALLYYTNTGWDATSPDWTTAHIRVLSPLVEVGDGTATPPPVNFTINPADYDASPFYLWIGDWNYTDEGVMDMTYTVSLPHAVGVSIAFDDDLLTPAPNWNRVDHVVRVARWEIRRGRQDEREKTEAAEATIYVKDTEGFLDAHNTDSPWFGKLDGKQVSINRWNPVDSTWYSRFRGTIEEYGHDLAPTQNVDEVAIVCVGFMDYLNGAEMAPGISGHPGGPDGVVQYDAQDINDRLADIIEVDAGLPTELDVIFSGNIVMQRSRYDGGYSYLAGAQDAADAEFPGVSNLYEDRFGRVVFHGRHARFDPDGVAADAGPDAWDFNRWKLGDGDAIIGDADYAQLRPPLHTDRSLKLLINAALVTPFGIDPADIAGQIVSDATSITSYGVRSYNAPDLRILEHKTNGDTGLQQCQKVGDFYVTNYKDPRTRPRQLTVKALHPDDPRAEKTWELMSKVDVSDVVHLLVAFPGTDGGFDEDFYVEGITETSRPGGPFTPVGSEFSIDEVVLDVSPTAFYNEDTFPDDQTGT